MYGISTKGTRHGVRQRAAGHVRVLVASFLALRASHCSCVWSGRGSTVTLSIDGFSAPATWMGTLPRSAEKALGSVTATLVRYPAPPRMLERLHDRLANFPGNLVGYTPLPVGFPAACHGRAQIRLRP